MDTQLEWDRVAEGGDAFGDCVWQASMKFLELGALAPGKVALDVACGAGGLTREIANRVRGGNGRVIGVDSSSRMIETARQRSPGIEHLTFDVRPADAIELPDNSVDVAFCRFALPLLADPVRTAARTLASLKPGGRFAVMGIGGVEHNDFFTLLGDAGGEPLRRSLALGRGTALANLLSEAGFENVKHKSIRALVTVADPQAYWSSVRSVLGIADPALPPQLAGFITPGRRLSLELVFALGTKRDPKAKARQAVRGMDEMVAAARRRIRELTPHEVKRKLKGEKVVYLDVREPEQRTTLLKGAVHVPRGDIEERIQALVPDPKAMILVYCERGRHSALAAKQLQDLGYENVWSLYGGITAWSTDGMPVERA